MFCNNFTIGFFFLSNFLHFMGFCKHIYFKKLKQYFNESSTEGSKRCTLLEEVKEDWWKKAVDVLKLSFIKPFSWTDVQMRNGMIADFFELFQDHDFVGQVIKINYYSIKKCLLNISIKKNI